MKKLIYICIIVGLTACNTNKKQTTDQVTATPTGLQGIQASAVNNVAPVSNQTSNNSGELNPAHGAPGHRCDLAVGAPLNSAPLQANTAQQVVSTQATAPQTTTASVNEKGQKLNPAHGLPNHRCDIAVGAPLSSAPAQVNATPQSVNKPQVTTATQQTTAPSVNEKGQRLNPAHGLPGHSCEIAVGAPLK